MIEGNVIHFKINVEDQLFLDMELEILRAIRLMEDTILNDSSFENNIIDLMTTQVDFGSLSRSYIRKKYGQWFKDNNIKPAFYRGFDHATGEISICGDVTISFVGDVNPPPTGELNLAVSLEFTNKDMATLFKLTFYNDQKYWGTT